MIVPSFRALLFLYIFLFPCRINLLIYTNYLAEYPRIQISHFVKHFKYSFHCFVLILFFYFLFPNPQDFPSPFFKSSRHFFIVLNVFFTLLLPVVCVIGWSGVSTIVTMPETAINKYRYSFLGENKVRMSFNFIVTPPTSDTIGVKAFD